LLDAEDIAFGVLNLDEPAHRRDLTFWKDDRATVGFHGGCGRVDIVDRDCAFVAEETLARHHFVALLHRALYAPVILVSRGNQEEARRPPGLESPAEDCSVELLRPRHVISMYREEHDIVRHL